jgi:hypothetical protein
VSSGSDFFFRILSFRCTLPSAFRPGTRQWLTKTSAGNHANFPEAWFVRNSVSTLKSLGVLRGILLSSASPKKPPLRVRGISSAPSVHDDLGGNAVAAGQAKSLKKTAPAHHKAHHDATGALSGNAFLNENFATWRQG